MSAAQFSRGLNLHEAKISYSTLHSQRMPTLYYTFFCELRLLFPLSQSNNTPMMFALTCSEI